MNGLLFSFNFPPNDGGIARLAAALFKQLKKKQKDTLLLTFEKVADADIQNTLIVPKWRIISEFLSFIKIKNFTGTIISTLWYPEGLIATFSKAKNKVVLVHGSELLPHPSPIKEYFLKHLKKYTLKKAKLIVANSQFTAKLVRNIIDHPQIIINTPAVDTNRFFPKDKEKAKEKFGLKEKFVMLTVAVVQEHKGYEMVFKAIQLLPPQLLENCVYLIAGKGKDEQKFKQLAIDLGIDKYIEWLGFVPDSDLNDLYNASDLFLLCSKNRIEERYVEGFGMVLLEAQACGVPVIGTQAGGIPDAIIQHAQNFLISEHDIKGLAHLIREKYYNPRQAILNATTLKSWEAYLEIIDKHL